MNRFSTSANVQHFDAQKNRKKKFTIIWKTCIIKKHLTKEI